MLTLLELSFSLNEVLGSDAPANEGAPNKPATPKSTKAFYNAGKVRART
jgi:hypothetical protein